MTSGPMSIRNATIALRLRKIGLSEQERLAGAKPHRRSHHAGAGRKQDGGTPVQRAEQAKRWHTSWVEG